MNIFINHRHELRSGWKFAAYWLIFLFLVLAASVTVASGAGPQTQLERLVFAVIPAIPAILTLRLMAKFVDKVPTAVFGATLHEHWKKDWTIGGAVSLALLAIVTLVNGAAGGVVMNWTASDASWRSLIVTPLVLIIAAAQEELVYRGYPLQVLIKGIGPWPAILVMSSAFGLLHLFNPNATLVGALNTVLAGVMLSLAYLKTRSLWLPYGLHVGWNLGLGFVLGYPLSGIDIDSLWTTIAYGPKWLVGTDYGPEGGIIGTIAFITGAVVIRRLRSTGVSPKLRALLSEN
jgi:membrane protease YdiL (CAAX protease family)